MLSVLKVKYSECNPDTMNEINAFLEKYKEKSYKLQELKAQGYYSKNKVTGIRIFGVKRIPKLLSYFSNKKETLKTKASLGLKKAETKKKNNFSKLLNPQNFFKMTKKTFGLFNKTNMEALFRRTRMLNLKEDASNLGSKTIEIRIDHNLPYESESINDVLPLKLHRYKIKNN